MRETATTGRIVQRALGFALAASLAVAGAAGAQNRPSRGTSTPAKPGTPGPPGSPRTPGTPAASAAAASPEPIECWWRTSPNSIRVGELFTIVLTCAVRETATTTIVPDQSRLDPAVFQLLPFEITSGTHAADIHVPDRRFFQYEYTARYIGEDFGKDLRLPSFSIPYRVQTRMERDAVIEGRDREYILPALVIRIASLFQDGANDIRDRPPETFRAIQAAHFRASVLRVIAWALFGLAVVGLLLALARLRRSEDTGAPIVVKHVSDAAILRSAARELAAVERLRQADGWSAALAVRALVPLRVAATYALGRHAAQVPAASGAAPSEGQLVVRALSRRGMAAALVSGSATADAVQQELARSGLSGHGDTQSLASLHLALALFSSIAYGRQEIAVSESDLDEALGGAGRAVAAVKREHGRLNTLRRTLMESASAMRNKAWAR